MEKGKSIIECSKGLYIKFELYKDSAFNFNPGNAYTIVTCLLRPWRVQVVLTARAAPLQGPRPQGVPVADPERLAGLLPRPHPFGRHYLDLGPFVR